MWARGYFVGEQVVSRGSSLVVRQAAVARVTVSPLQQAPLAAALLTEGLRAKGKTS
ncbi:hypothetical protein [Kyrpidia spormannii]|uniref:hypothetical protein n=1 Tax=Kyrpidia spormannii TaxID=2055160 RepID=UPI0018E41A11|nr:hypothetical protein [Kyrpidia spormannii]